MRIILSALTLLLSVLSFNLSAQNTDSLQLKADSIKLKEDTARMDCEKAELYTNMAANLIAFNRPQTREISYSDAGKAIDYVLKAIHLNSKFDDVLAIRNNYDCLASAYFIQKKYAQAKWFLLQSNHISRYRNDYPALINSLMKIASVKIAIKDYSMAEKDFKEAIALTIRTSELDRQIEIEKCLATLYSNSGKGKAAIAMEKHYTLLQKSLDDDIAQIAKQKQLREQGVVASPATKTPARKGVVLAQSKQAAVYNDTYHTQNNNNETPDTVTRLITN